MFNFCSPDVTNDRQIIQAKRKDQLTFSEKEIRRAKEREALEREALEKTG